MKILTVIPISKGVFRDNLDYFTSKNLNPGALVEIPVRKKIIPALVVRSEEIKKTKAALKNSEFALRPIKSVLSECFLPPKFVSACVQIADYFISPIGVIIKNLVPQAVLESPPETICQSAQDVVPFGHNKITTFQAPLPERIQYYKSIIREEFAKKQSVFFCLPTMTAINDFANELQKGIEKYTFVLHGKLPKKKMREIWTQATSEKHPVLIIATKSFLSIPREDMGTLILEEENSSFYKIQTRPYIDIRKVAKIISRETGMRLIFGDGVIRTETYHNASSTPVARIMSEAEQCVVDMKKESNKTFFVLGAKMKKMIQDGLKNNEKIILLINRRGHSPTTVCNECFKTILCEKCEAPLVLHKGETRSKNVKFVCHKCLTETIAPEQCPYCQSWRLQTLGIGIQKTEEEIIGLFPGAQIYKIDGDSVTSQKQGEEIVKNFITKGEGILLGTEMLFSYIKQPVERVGLVSADSLFALPDFRTNEKIFNTLLKLRALAKKTFLVQTRLPEQTVFNDALRGNISGFYKTELESREMFGYPPFKTLIKITKESKNEIALQTDIQNLKSKLQNWDPLTYPAFTSKIKNLYVWHILIRTEPDTWPNNQQELHQILCSLPPAWKINIDPESLL